MLAPVVVTGEHVRSLEQFTPTGSRLNLSAKDTPATLDVITSDTMQTRGFLTVEEAADSMPGVTSGGTPGDLSDFHIRGFSDPQITLLHNGIYVGPSTMINRPQNSFNIESVEILKGPASVLYGQGAIGGAVNDIRPVCVNRQLWDNSAWRWPIDGIDGRSRDPSRHQSDHLGRLRPSHTQRLLRWDGITALEALVGSQFAIVA